MDVKFKRDFTIKKPFSHWLNLFESREFPHEFRRDLEKIPTTTWEALQPHQLLHERMILQAPGFCPERLKESSAVFLPSGKSG